jgi:uncharacterized NAD(P)/FAD-binding protein YdhS
MIQGPPSRVYDIAIVGAGASGTLLAIQLLRQAASGVRVALLDRAGAFGRGRAFATQDPEHLLDERADRMSALPEEPDHFVRWLARLEPGTSGEAFAPRRRYARYLGATLEEARRTGRRVGARADPIEADVIAVEATPKGMVLSVSGTGPIAAPVVVLAFGLPPALDPAVPDDGVLASRLYARSPGTRDALAGLPVEAAVLLLGAGLTAVDVALTLRAAGHRGPIHALAPRPLLPLASGEVQAPPISVDLAGAGGRLSRLLRCARIAAAGAPAQAEGADWRSAVDALRGQAQHLWQELSEPEQRRFLRHLRPFWEAHRHRLPSEAARKIDALRTSGLLRLEAGRLSSLALAGGLAEARWRRRGGGEGSGRFGRIVNCAEPALALAPLATPLVASLFKARLARRGPLGIGLDTEGLGAVRDASGMASERLFALGPLRTGERWESSAVQELRSQAAALARHLLARAP